MAGRPTEYNAEMLAKAQEYLNSCEDETIPLGDGEHTYKVKLPKIEGLAVFLGVSRDTLYEWEKIYPEFSDILEIVRSKQADRLIDKGLSGDYNSTITKLMLTKHGYTDKQDLTTDGKSLNITFDPVFNAVTRTPETSSPESSPIQNS